MPDHRRVERPLPVSAGGPSKSRRKLRDEEAERQRRQARKVNTAAGEIGGKGGDRKAAAKREG